MIVMNLNQSVIHKKPEKGFGLPKFKVKEVMGPPNKPGPKTRTNKQKFALTPSSGTQWGQSCHSVVNTSTLRSGSTTISSEAESRVIIALTEGRGEARCEVGLASIDLSLPTLILCQISDSQSYINTLTKINIFNPTDILVPSTFLENDSRLIDKVKKKFPNLKILRVPRKTFNRNAGMDRIKQLCLPSVNTISVGLQHKYYALAAAAALTTYLQNNLNVYYAKSSLNITYQESEGYAVIDVSTADRLELVSCTKPAQASRYSTLFGVLNHCVTRGGARLLRSTILQPPSAAGIIETTSQTVAELIKHPETHTSIQAILQKVANIDQLLTITSMALGTIDSCSVRQLNYLLLLNSLIDVIEPLKNIIERCQQPFFKELKSTLESENFASITEKIRTMIHPQAYFAKSEAGATQRCFAIKSGINGLLDLVRKTYSERLNDLTEYVRNLGNKYSLSLTLGNNNTKGYHIVLKLNKQQKRTFKKSDLPSEFIQVYRLAASCTMKTAELINFSTRLDDIMSEILKLSNSMIYKIMVDLKQYVGFFYKLCEDIARLDMLQSLAEASKRGGYVRPKFGEFTEVINARHPMLEMLIGEQSVANPISICENFNVQIITGPNGSGKSIYIRQVMLLQIMAQVGCYVPAESAIFRPMSRMFARIYLEDDIEYGASSFILEMKEVKYMMTLLSKNSLFIIDELCRSTAADEGTALAMAICEKFCTTGVFLFVTTHYTSLADLYHLYLNVKTWQMETIATGDRPQDLSLEFRFKLIPGVTNLKHYGIYIVKEIWPETILQEVYKILDNIKRDTARQERTGINEAVRLKYKLESDLRKLKSLGILTRASINKVLNEYQNNLQKMNIYINLDNIPEENFGDKQVTYHPSNDGLCQNQDLHRSYLSSTETSSYKKLSNFLQEDGDNINMLIPEVSISYSNRELHLSEEYNDEASVCTPDYTSQSAEFATPICTPNNTLQSEIFATSTCTSLDTLQPKPIESYKTPNLCDTNFENFTEAERAYIMEELEIASQSFMEDDNYDFSQDSSYKTASGEVESHNQNPPQHIFPIVRVVEGPKWSPDSSFSSSPRHIEKNDDDGESESISYSPLCSLSVADNIVSKTSDQTSLNNSNLPEPMHTSTSSSLPFLAKKGVVITSDTNLDNIDNTLADNLKSTSTEKPANDAKTSTSSSLKEGYSDSTPNKKQRRPKSFIPPKKLTKKEIQEEFDQQDRKFYESDVPESELPKYLSHILNRPSVRQVQNSKHLAFVRKTKEGVEVIPAKPEPMKKRKAPFQRNLSSSGNNVDISIFSDKNAKCFDEFLNSDERDVKKFKFNIDIDKEKRFDSQEFNFRPQSISEYAENMDKVPFLFKPTNYASSDFHSLTPLTPDGYYKQNKDDINSIVNKYLQSGECPNESSIFETSSLNENDLEL